MQVQYTAEYQQLIAKGATDEMAKNIIRKRKNRRAARRRAGSNKRSKSSHTASKVLAYRAMGELVERVNENEND